LLTTGAAGHDKEGYDIIKSFIEYKVLMEAEKDLSDSGQQDAFRMTKNNLPQYLAFFAVKLNHSLAHQHISTLNLWLPPTLSE
jgi:hypothetical protein